MNQAPTLNLRSVIDFFASDNDKEECFEIFIGKVDVNGSGPQRAVFDAFAESVRAQSMASCFIIIADQEALETANLSYNIRKPRLVVLVFDTNTLSLMPTQDKIPMVAVSLSNRKIIQRNTFGDMFDGIWSSREGRVIMRKQYHDMDNLNALQNRNIRIIYNNWKPMFARENNTNDPFFLESLYLNTYVEKRSLVTVYTWAENEWGPYNATTNIWGGVIGRVGYKTEDLGIGFIFYTQQRNEFAAYTAPVAESVNRFISKYPGQISPFFNVLKVYDGNTWMGISISLVVVTLAVLFLVHWNSRLGFHKPDFVMVVMMPFGILNSEQCPDWFINKNTNSIWKRGASGSIILIFWCLFSTVIVYSFQCNLRAILIRPAYNTPIDTAEQAVKNEMVFWVYSESAFTLKYLRSSTNQWRKQLTDAYKIFGDGTVDEKFETVMANEKNIVVGEKSTALYVAKNNDKLQRMERPLFYFSKEQVRPYYTGWIIQKESIWREDLDRHIRLCQQAGLDRMFYNRLDGDQDFAQQTPTERLSFEHVALGFLILLVGTVLASVVFLAELLVKKEQES